MGVLYLSESSPRHSHPASACSPFVCDPFGSLDRQKPLNQPFWLAIRSRSVARLLTRTATRPRIWPRI